MELLVENGLVRVLTFQSKEVLDKLTEQTIYYADTNKAREHRDYIADIEQLNGYNPIWGFGFKKTHDKQFWYKSMLETFRCELSLNSRTLADFVCIELFVPEHLVKIGITHNSCDFAVVFPYINIDMVHQVYSFRIEGFNFGTDYNYKLPVVSHISMYKYSYQPTFEVGFRTLTMEEYSECENSIPNTFPLLPPKSLKLRKEKLCNN